MLIDALSDVMPERRICSTELVGSLTKWFPIRGIRRRQALPAVPYPGGGPTAATAEAAPRQSLDEMVDGIVAMTDLIATMECEFTNYVMFAKQQASEPTCI